MTIPSPLEILALGDEYRRGLRENEQLQDRLELVMLQFQRPSAAIYWKKSLAEQKSKEGEK